MNVSLAVFADPDYQSGKFDEFEVFGPENFTPTEGELLLAEKFAKKVELLNDFHGTCLSALEWTENCVSLAGEFACVNDTLHARDSMGRTRLMLAIMDKNIERAAVLMYQAGRTDLNGRSALVYAIMHDLTCLMAPLLQLEADMRDNNGKSALMYAAQFGSANSVAILCLQEFNLVGFGDNDGRTALMYATLNAKVDTKTVQLLADFEARFHDHNERTALMLAAAAGNTVCVSVLCDSKYGLIGKRDENGFTALIYAIKGLRAVRCASDRAVPFITKGVTTVSDEFAYTAVIHDLLPEACITTNANLNALDWAVEYNLPDIAELLIPHCISAPVGQLCPVIRAIEVRNGELALTLIEAGFGERDLHDEDGNTALMLAVKNGLTGVVERLASWEHGVLNHFGESALMISLSYTERVSEFDILLQYEHSLPVAKAQRRYEAGEQQDLIHPLEAAFARCKPMNIGKVAKLACYLMEKGEYTADEVYEMIDRDAIEVSSIRVRLEEAIFGELRSSAAALKVLIEHRGLQLVNYYHKTQVPAVQSFTIVDLALRLAHHYEIHADAAVGSVYGLKVVFERAFHVITTAYTAEEVSKQAQSVKTRLGQLSRLLHCVGVVETRLSELAEDGEMPPSDMKPSKAARQSKNLSSLNARIKKVTEAFSSDICKVADKLLTTFQALEGDNLSLDAFERAMSFIQSYCQQEAAEAACVLCLESRGLLYSSALCCKENFFCGNCKRKYNVIGEHKCFVCKNEFLRVEQYFSIRVTPPSQ